MVSRSTKGGATNLKVGGGHCISKVVGQYNKNTKFEKVGVHDPPISYDVTALSLKAVFKQSNKVLYVSVGYIKAWWSSG